MEKNEELELLKHQLAEEQLKSKIWEHTARMHYDNECYYRGLLVNIGEMFGADARTQDDGNIIDDVLVSKVPELVQELMKNNKIRIWKALKN
jgi:hypothetical protein